MSPRPPPGLYSFANVNDSLRHRRCSRREGPPLFPRPKWPNPRPTYKAPPPAHLAHLGAAAEPPLVDHSKPPSSVGGSDVARPLSRSSDGERRHFTPRHSSLRVEAPLKPGEVKRADPVRASSASRSVAVATHVMAWATLGSGGAILQGTTTHLQLSITTCLMQSSVAAVLAIERTHGQSTAGKRAVTSSAHGKKRRGYTLEMSRSGIPCKSGGDKLSIRQQRCRILHK